MTDDELLHDRVQEFADEITATVRAVLGDRDVALRSTILGDHVSVVTADPGIELECDGAKVLALKVRYQCGWDSSGRFLAVEASEFHVFAKGDGEPLFRIEFRRDSHRSIPVARRRDADARRGVRRHRG